MTDTKENAHAFPEVDAPNIHIQPDETDFYSIRKMPQLSSIIWKICNTEQYIRTDGRDNQTLFYLWKAKKRNRGITALDVSSWALRLATYIYRLRKKGVDITTRSENQRLKGYYGRYYLETEIEPLRLYGVDWDGKDGSNGNQV